MQLSNVIDMTGRLHVDLFHQGKLLPNNLDMRIKLGRHKDAFCLVKATTDDDDYKLEILSTSPTVHKARINPTVFKAFSKPEHTFKYAINRIECKSIPQSAGIRDIFLSNLFLGTLPMFVVVELV